MKRCAVGIIGLLVFVGSGNLVLTAVGQETIPAASAATRVLGTVTSISSQSIVLKTDAGSEFTVAVNENTKLLQLKPGEKDLKSATPLALSDLKTGDRVLVRGIAGTDSKLVQAISVIAMKQTDIADKQAHDRTEWQRNGVGGLVKNVDANAGLISVTANGIGAAKTVSVHVGKSTVLRRYAADSIKFDDAKPAPIADVKPGDQLRARGQKSADGTELDADEIVSGTFRSIAGILLSADTSAGTLIVTDLATKQPVTLHISSDSQLRKLPSELAQGIAMRLRGTPAGGPAGTNTGLASPSAPKPEKSGQAASPAMPSGNGNGGQGRSGDFQQMLVRTPKAGLADFQKGDALMIVATEGAVSKSGTVITLLGGVEPILQASSNATPDMILSPWTLGSGGGGEGSTP